MSLLATLADTAPTRKDVVIGETGAAAAFAGFVLVFLGVLVTSYQALLGHATTPTLARFKTASWPALGAFGLGICSVSVSTAWLAVDGGRTFYLITLGVFFAEVVALFVVAVYSACRVLLK
jgi:hypothetical protein